MSHTHDISNRLIRCLGLITIVIFGMISTVGSGGGGDGTSGPQPLTYNGNTEPATITLDNVPTLVANVLYGGSSTTDIPTAASTSTLTNRSAGAVVVTDYLRIVIQHSLERINENNLSGHDIVSGFTVNEPMYCDSGSANLSGQLNDSTGTGTLTFTYDNCMLDGITYDGTGAFRVDYFDFGYLYPTDATMNFTLMTMSGPEFNGSISGTIRMETLFATNSIRMTMNYVAKDNRTNKMYKFDNFIATSVYDNIYTPTTLSMQFTGSPARSYDSIHGYVDVDTPTPLVYSSVNLPNPDSDGVMLFFGKDSANIRLTVLSGEQVQLELNIDGIPGYEITRILPWTELTLTSTTDINDSDNDGMPDSWESDHSLDPLDGSDADQDADGDGFTNLKEYLAGSNPNDPLSTPPPHQIRELALQTNDIVYDPLSGKIYASIPAGATSAANSIAIINPIVGQVETTIPVGSDPGPLDISGDGQFLYVGLNGSATIKQFIIANQTSGLEFALGSDSFFGPYYAEDIETLPGDPSAIAVSRKYSGVSPRHAGVGIYDNGVPRLDVTVDHTGSNVIEFGQSASTLYGYNNETTEFGFRVMLVDADGVTVVDVTQNLISGFSDIKYDGGRIYSTTARVIDPVTKTIIGTFAIDTSFNPVQVEPDSSVGRVFFLTTGINNMATLQAFDINTLVLVGSLGISGVNGNPTSLIRWGSNGLAFGTDQNQVYLIETTLVQ